jgi:exosortase/archaeosortase family protein
MRAEGRSLGRVLLTFLLIYITLQCAWNEARGTAIERWIIDDITVVSTVTLINAVTPGVAAVARGPRIAATGGSLNVRSGCEGTETLFPLFAALLAVPLSWRVRLLGASLGVLLIFALNQARLLALFYSARNNPALFASLHGVVGPLLLMFGALTLFLSLLPRADRSPRLGIDK